VNPNTACRWLAVLILLGIAAHKYATIRKPAGVEEYHRRIRESARLVPSQIDGWVGRDAPVPVQAIKVLDPNLMISKSYVNVETGQHAGFMFVHCSDAHDMAGHFPLRCYPAKGWDTKSSRRRDWQAGDLRVTGMEYEFFAPESIDGGRPESSIVVANFLMRPGGQIWRDMDGMTRSIIGAGGQSSGAAQLQIHFDASVPEEKRDAAIVALIKGYRPVIDAVLAALPKAN
jgi:Protein of unknown function (DUF3485)